MSAPEITVDAERLRVHFKEFGPEAYQVFLKAKAIPETAVEFVEADESYVLTAPARFAPMLGVPVPKIDRGGLSLSPFLFDDQAAIVPMILDSKRFACWSHCGGGKALRHDEPVLTPTGWIAVESLRVGDFVVGSDGRQYSVTGVFPQGVRPLYRVTFSDGVSVVCDHDHLWYVESQWQRYHDRPGGVLPTSTLLNEKLVDDMGRHKYYVPLVKPVDFPAQNLPIDPYTLGVLLGDGSLINTPMLTTADPEILDLLVLPSSVKIRPVISAGKCPSYSLSIRKGGFPRVANPLVVLLESLGLMKKRAWEKHIPHQYLRGSIEQRRAMLAGLLDTDGSFSLNRVEYSTTSRELADGVAEIVQSLGGIAPITERHTSYTYLNEKRLGRLSYRLNIKLPGTECPFRLTRKREVWKPRRHDAPPRMIVSIEPTEAALAVCISVDSPDKLYVTRGHVLTHNTVIGLETALHVAHRTGGRTLIITLNDIVNDWVREASRFYGDKLPLRRLHSRAEMRDYCANGPGQFAVTNYEKMNPEDLDHQVVPEMKNLALVALDEANRLAIGGGKQKWALIKSCKGIEYKLLLTATPAPNDYMEYASQASFLEKMRSQDEIIWTFFIRDEKTHRWTIKPHARKAFFEFMSSWSIYVNDPKRYGWRLNQPDVPPAEIIVHEIEMTDEQRRFMAEYTAGADGQMQLVQNKDTNTVQRSKMSQVAKGFVYQKGKTGKNRAKRIDSKKPAFVCDLVKKEVASGLQVLVWTIFDEENVILSEILTKLDVPHDTLTGDTKEADRLAMIERFESGQCPVLISRSSMIGFGKNFQNCGAMVFSGWSDSFVQYFQAVRRAMRFGQLRRVRVHLPCVEDLEEDQLENIFRKEGKHLEAIEEMEDNYIKARKRRLDVERKALAKAG